MESTDTQTDSEFTSSDRDVGRDVAAGEAILEVEDLEKHFGGITAVDGATFDIEKGAITGLIGPNGAGKTTTFNLISGFYEPDGGEIRYGGVDMQEIMQPSDEEARIWTAAGGITLGGTALAAAASAGLGPVGMAGAAVVGAGFGASLYYGQEWTKRNLLDWRYTRPFQAARAGLSRTFQITRALEGMTVRENLMLAPMGQSGERLVSTWFRQEKVADEEAVVRERADEMLELLEIDHLADQEAGGLSGGQGRLLELGRVLMTDPELILLDEPVAGVNPTLTQKLLERIEDLSDQGYTFCLVEHDMEVIMNLSDTIIVMDQGDVLTEGTPAEVQQDERVVDAYLGG